MVVIVKIHTFHTFTDATRVGIEQSGLRLHDSLGHAHPGYVFEAGKFEFH